MEPDVPAVQELRAKFESARERAGATEVRAAAVAYYRARAAQGATQRLAAEELGITQWALSKWHQKHGRQERTADGEGQRPSLATSAEGAALKQEVEGLGPRNPSRRFPPELKQRITEWAREELARGLGALAVAQQVGVPWESLSRWLGLRRPKIAATKLRSVRVVGNAPNAMAVGMRGPVLRSPGGFIVEGLDLPALVEALRQLG